MEKKPYSYKLFILMLIGILIFLFIFNKHEPFYEYDVYTGKDQQKNMLTDSPYDTYIDNDTKEKLFTLFPFGSIDEFGFNSQSHTYNAMPINTNVLLDKGTKWKGELDNKTNCIDNIPQLHDFSVISNSTYCGSFGNICASTFDCCGGLSCVSERCQQI